MRIRRSLGLGMIHAHVAVQYALLPQVTVEYDVLPQLLNRVAIQPVGRSAPLQLLGDRPEIGQVIQIVGAAAVGELVVLQQLQLVPVAPFAARVATL